MSVTTNTYLNSFTGDGVTTLFPFTMRVVDASSLQVFFGGTIQSTSLYVATINDNGIGGTIAFDLAPPAGTAVAVQRASDLNQNVSLGFNEPLPPGTIVNMADKLTIIAQQLLTLISNGFTAPPGLTAFSGVLPTSPIGGALIGINGAGTNAAYVSPVQAGFVLTDNGPGQLPTYQASTGGSGGGGGTPVTIDTSLSTILAAVSNVLKAVGARGDIPYLSAANTVANLAIGANGTIVKSNGTVPTWGANDGGAVAAAPVSVTGGAPIVSGTIASNALTLTALAAAANTVLANITGASAAPTYTSAASVVTAGGAVTGATGGSPLVSGAVASNSLTLTASQAPANSVLSNITGAAAVPAYNAVNSVVAAGGAATSITGGSPLVSGSLASNAITLAALTAAAKTVLSNLTAGTSTPAYNSVASVVNAGLPLTTAGDMLIMNASPTPARVALGTTGQVWQVLGTGLPGWAAAGGGGVSQGSIDRTFPVGGVSNLRPFPTSGAVSGDYYQAAAWTQTGVLTATSVRIYAGSTMAFTNIVNVVTEMSGGATQVSPATGYHGVGMNGTGFGAGGGAGNADYQGNVNGGGGGGYGGAGGHGGSNGGNSAPGQGGGTYPLSASLSGSGGGGGGGGATGVPGSPGGPGGGSFAVEALGAITLSASAAINAIGGTTTTPATGFAGGGGGGSGGSCSLKSYGAGGSITLAAGAIINVGGGNGAVGSSVISPGGGGGGGYADLTAPSITNGGTISAAGGLGGTSTPSSVATNGATGVVNLNVQQATPRSVG